MKYRRMKDPALVARRRRRRIAVLPALLTLGNCLCGFASLHYTAMGDNLAPASPLTGSTTLGVSNYAFAGYLIFLAMVFDLFDGFMARLARATSDFGGELDSLADMVSFGVAPAFLALSVISRVMSPAADATGPYDALDPMAESLLGRLFWVIGAIYVSCTALRLARFNVHNQHREDAHMKFQGLPSPGAAGVVASSVIFFETLQPAAHHVLWFQVDPHFSNFLRAGFPYAMPVILLGSALLMVSRLNFAHVINQYLRGRRPLGYIVRLVVVVALLMVWPQLTALAVIYLYALSAPVAWAYRRVFRRNEPALVERAELHDDDTDDLPLRG